jgi:glyoxylase-like metal-dependent hydrolase (beta-lactamase superfamily II)
MRKLLVVMVVMASCLRFAAAASEKEPDWSKVEIKAQKVAGNVYLLEGLGGEFSGGNVAASVGPDGILLIDDKFAPLAPKIQAALKTLSDKPVRFVLNTHVHMDHTGGNGVMGKGATIIAHDNTRARLIKHGWGREGKPVPAEALPIITFAEELGMHVNGEDIRIVYVPAGHTDTDVVVIFPKSKVVHMGDDYFNALYPFIDFDSGGSVKGYVAGVEKVLGMIPADAKIIPGHGSLSTTAELRAYLAMLKDVTGSVEAGIKAGKTVEQLTQAKPTAKYDAVWGHGFLSGDDFVQELYRGLSKR